MVLKLLLKSALVMLSANSKSPEGDLLFLTDKIEQRKGAMPTEEILANLKSDLKEGVDTSTRLALKAEKYNGMLTEDVPLQYVENEADQPRRDQAVGSRPHHDPVDDGHGCPGRAECRQKIG